MSETNENKLVPKLRFPEFNKDGEWKVKTLGEVAEKRIRKNKNVAVRDVFTNSANSGIVNQRDYFDKDIANQNNLEGYYIIEINDFVYNPRISNAAPVGPISRNKIGVGVMSPLYSVFKFIEGNLDFIEHFFATNIWHKYMQDIGNNGARADRMSFSVSDFYEMPILFPSLKEQQKIADCLSSLDEIITAESQKLEVLKEHKKGLLQNLFPQEGETVPKVRFKEFEDDLIQFGLADLGEIKIGLTHTPKYINSGVPFLSSKNISNGYIDFENVQYISREEFSGITESAKPKVGDILFTRVGSNLGNPIILEQEKEFAIFVSLGIFRANKKTFNYYLKYWMESDYFWLQLERKVAGGAKNNLNTNWLREFKLFLPSFSEQQKIASCLSSLDDLINAQSQKVESLRLHKKGLLQGLFPDVNEANV